MSWYCYILVCADQTLYTGITNDIEARLLAHNSPNKGAKYTRGRRPVKLFKSFIVDSKSAALKLECRIKRMTRQQKLAYEHSV